LNILFWDIDGTLLRAARAGIYAFQEATEELYHTLIDFTGIKTSGMTDYYIAEQIINNITGHQSTHEKTSALIKRYEELLPAHLAARKGIIMPSVQAILVHFDKRQDYISLLLTGNTYAAAAAKLRHYGLAKYFDFTASAFCHQSPDRSAIASQALQSIQQHYPSMACNNIFIIGDTPNDIQCGKAIGARTIAVATGIYSLDVLSSHKPWWAIECLPSPAEFESKLQSLT
jgi:phosphoglycolate phosphatase